MNATDRGLAILGVSEVASMGMIAALLGTKTVEGIRADCEASGYWADFCRAVGDGYDPEEKLPGAIGRSLGFWAKDTLLGVVWWNSLTPLERTRACDAAHSDTPAAVYRHWRKTSRGCVGALGAELTREQIAILDHTVHRAADGLYCGGGKDMDALVAAGLMESAGRKSFVPDEYFRITGAGQRALRAHNARGKAVAA